MKFKDHTYNWSDWFTYDESSPSFLVWNHDKLTYKGSPTKIKKGMVAGWKDTDYYKVELFGNTFKAHQIVYEIHFGEIPEDLWFDHKDGNRFNNHPSNLRTVEHRFNTRNRSKPVINTSGVIGVAFNSKLSKNKLVRSDYWAAQWASLEGKKLGKYFSIKKFGNEEAFRMACEYRAERIKDLNEQGAGYSERHGT